MRIYTNGGINAVKPKIIIFILFNKYIMYKYIIPNFLSKTVTVTVKLGEANQNN